MTFRYPETLWMIEGLPRSVREDIQMFRERFDTDHEPQISQIDLPKPKGLILSGCQLRWYTSSFSEVLVNFWNDGGFDFYIELDGDFIAELQFLNFVEFIKDKESEKLLRTSFEKLFNPVPTPLKEISLDDFLVGLRKNIDSFEENYRKGMKENPTSWPEKMNPGDWDEQFIMHSTDE